MFFFGPGAQGSREDCYELKDGNGVMSREMTYKNSWAVGVKSLAWMAWAGGTIPR